MDVLSPRVKTELLAGKTQALAPPTSISREILEGCGSPKQYGMGEDKGKQATPAQCGRTRFLPPR